MPLWQLIKRLVSSAAGGQFQVQMVRVAELQRRLIFSNVRRLMKKEWDPEKWDGDIWVDAFEEEGDHTQKEVKDP